MADDILAELQRALDSGLPAAPAVDMTPLEEMEAAAADHEARVGQILGDFLGARAEIAGRTSQADRDAEIARIKAEAGI